MQTLAADDNNKEQSLADSDIDSSAATMNLEEGCRDREDTQQRQRSLSLVAISMSIDDSTSSPPAVFNVTKKSIVGDNDNGSTILLDEAKKNDDTKQDFDFEFEEEMIDNRASTTGSSGSSGGTNEESIPVTSKELSSEHGIEHDEPKIYVTKVNGQRMDAAEDVSVAEKCENFDGGALDSTLKLVEIGNDSNQLLQYSQTSSFLSPSKVTQSNETFTRSLRNEKQDEYVKKGARVKAILASALQAVANGFANHRVGNSSVLDGNSSNGGNDDIDGEKKSAKHDNVVHLQDLAKKKSEQCLVLKRKLEECQLQIQCLQNECSSSELNATQLQSKIDRTLEALKIAGVNAANARAEADAANARADSLSGQLNDLQAVIEDTKNCMEIVRREHDEVSHAARSVEGRLIQVESDLTRAAKVKREAEEERDILKSRAEKSEKLARVLKENVNDCQDEIRRMKKDMAEMDELEKMRSERTHRIESELQDARAGLLEATSAAAEAESTVTSLRSVIDELRRDNESLHVQIDESQNAMSKERTKQNETLTLAEKEAQKYRLKCEEVEEENRKWKMDHDTKEKQVDQLKSRIANLERRINEKSGVTSSVAVAPEKNIVTPKNAADLGVLNAFGSNDGSAGAGPDEGNKRKYVSELPMREQPKNPSDSFSRQLTYSSAKSNPGKENESNTTHSLSTDSNKRTKKVQSINICCLCYREGGMILRCQCNNVNCELRAHPICVGKFRLGKAASDKTILCIKA